MSENQKPALDITGDAKPSVPVFSCVIHLRKVSEGIHANVANLAGLECTASNERDAIAKLVPAFKQRIAALMDSGEPVPWIDPIPTIEDDQQQRLIPVHL